MSRNSDELRNLSGIFRWLDHLVGGYFAIAVAVVVLWITIVFPLAVIWWAWPHVQAFLQWLQQLFA